MILQAATDPGMSDYFSPVQVGSYIGQFVTLLVAVFALIQVAVSKKIKTPADNQAERDFAYRLIKERLDEANNDREVLTKTVNYLREDARKRDMQDTEDYQREQERTDLIRSLNTRITELDSKVNELQHRLGHIGSKVRNGEAITLSDVYGKEYDDLDDGLGDVELTQVP